MDASQIMNILLPGVFVLVGVALIWFVVELAKTVKSTRQTVDELQKQITPTLEHVEQITNDLQPAVAKIDPLIERVSLTVDAANLELMRVDQILEDVNDVTDTASNAASAIDSVTSAPAELVTAVSDKVRGLLKGHRVSTESAQLASKNEEATMAAVKEQAETDQATESVVDRIVDAAVKGADSETEETPEAEKYFTYGQAGQSAKAADSADQTASSASAN